MKMTLKGGPLDGGIVDLIGWPVAICLTHHGKPVWYYNTGPPEDSGESIDTCLYFKDDLTYDRASDMGMGEVSGATEVVSDNFRYITAQLNMWLE